MLSSYLARFITTLQDVSLMLQNNKIQQTLKSPKFSPLATQHSSGSWLLDCFGGGNTKQSPVASLKEDIKKIATKSTEELISIATWIGELSLDAELWHEITLAIYSGKFGSNPQVLAPLASSLANIKFTSFSSQRPLAQALKDRKFGYNPQVLQNLTDSTNRINFTDSDSVEYLNRAFTKGCFGNFVPNMIKAKISKSIYSADIYHALEKEHPALKEHCQFASEISAYNYLENSIDLKLQTNSNLESCFTSEQAGVNFGYGTHGITYDNQGTPEFLIIYSEDQNQQNKDEIAERLSGFLYAKPEYKFLYQDNIKHLKVFALQTRDNYPRKLELSESSQKFANFPKWLQQAIVINKFNPDN